MMTKLNLTAAMINTELQNKLLLGLLYKIYTFASSTQYSKFSFHCVNEFCSSYNQVPTTRSFVS